MGIQLERCITVHCVPSWTDAPAALQAHWVHKEVHKEGRPNCAFIYVHTTTDDEIHEHDHTPRSLQKRHAALSGFEAAFCKKRPRKERREQMRRAGESSCAERFKRFFSRESSFIQKVMLRLQSCRLRRTHTSTTTTSTTTTTTTPPPPTTTPTTTPTPTGRSVYRIACSHLTNAGGHAGGWHAVPGLGGWRGAHRTQPLRRLRRAP